MLVAMKFIRFLCFSLIYCANQLATKCILIAMQIDVPQMIDVTQFGALIKSPKNLRRQRLLRKLSINLSVDCSRKSYCDNSLNVSVPDSHACAFSRMFLMRNSQNMFVNVACVFHTRLEALNVMITFLD